jgi:uncharacterized glyoxalase superfamily protein PhnB
VQSGQARVTLPGGKVLTIVLRIGDSHLPVASEFPQAGILSPASIGGTAAVLQVQTDDAGALWQRALDAGAQVHHELAHQFWGERHGRLTDPFGHRWSPLSPQARSGGAQPLPRTHQVRHPPWAFSRKIPAHGHAELGRSLIHHSR